MKNDPRLGFVRVAAAQPAGKVGNCHFNLEHHLTLMSRAQSQGVDILLFPELSISSYTLGVLFQQEALQAAALDSLECLRKEKCFSGLLIVGCPLAVGNALFNCAVVFQDGQYLGVVPKSFIPDYKEFTEGRWFAPASATKATTINLGGANVPFGTDLLFKAGNFPKLIAGIEICEDLWGPIPPSSVQALNGALIHFNLSASTEQIGKAAYRLALVQAQSARCLSAYVYAGCGISESTSDVVYSGPCIIAENGSVLAESKRFQSGDNLLVADVDIDRLLLERMRTTSFNHALSHYRLEPRVREILFHLKPTFAVIANKPDAVLRRYVDPHPFVPSSLDKLNERCEEIFNIQVAGVGKRLTHLHYPDVTIGVSGGLDSTHALSVL